MFLSIAFRPQAILLIVVLMTGHLLLGLNPMSAIVVIVLYDLRLFDLGIGLHVGIARAHIDVQ